MDYQSLLKIAIEEARTGIDFYGDNLFTTEAMLARHPGRKLFREASLIGWKYAMAHEEEIIRLIYNKYSQRHSVEHLRFEAEQMKRLMPDIVEIGHMYPGIALIFPDESE